MDRSGAAPKGMGVLVFTINLPDNQIGRPMGYAGRRQFKITGDIVLKKGHKEVKYKATEKKPIVVTTMLQRLEGKALNR